MVQRALRNNTKVLLYDDGFTEFRSKAVGRPTQIEALISFRAYEIYIARGREPGHDVDDWLRAEVEVVRQRINSLAL